MDTVITMIRRSRNLRSLSAHGNSGSRLITVDSYSRFMEDKGRASGDVKSLAEKHLIEVDKRLEELQQLRATLSHLVHSCPRR